MPRVPSSVLPADSAQVAINCDPFMSLKPLPQMLEIAGITFVAGANSTIYRYGADVISDTQYWFHWNAETVDVVRSAINNDQTERTCFVLNDVAYITDQTEALVGGSGDYPWASYKLGVPVPANAATATPGGPETGTLETRFYIYTHVTGWGEESAPSNPVQVEVYADQTLTLSNFEAFANGTDYNVTARRIYRTISGSAATDFQYVDEIALADTSYIDTILGGALGEVCPSFDWETPPAMTGMIGIANGINVGFKGTDLYVSAAYRPYAWPSGYRLSTNYAVVGAKSFGNYAVICTTGNPYLLHGTDPSSMSLTKIELPQSCVSRRSIVEIGSGVIYASPDGLVYVSATEPAQVITENMVDQNYWDAIVPTSISGYVWEGRYIGFYDTGAVQAGFMFNLTTGKLTLLDFHATAGYQDLLQDALYLKVGTKLYRFAADADFYTFTWKSKRFNLPRPINFAWAQVVAKSYPVEFTFFSDGVSKHVKSVANAAPFRLPSGFLSDHIEFQLVGDDEVYLVHIADSLEELRGL